MWCSRWRPAADVFSVIQSVPNTYGVLLFGRLLASVLLGNLMNHYLPSIQWSGTWDNSNRSQSICWRGCSNENARQLHRHRNTIRLPTRQSHIILEWIWLLLRQRDKSAYMERRQCHADTYRPALLCHIVLVPRKSSMSTLISFLPN
jgi:hypothetical protein